MKRVSHLVWSVAENYRYIPSIVKASEAVKAGRIGRILLSQFNQRGYVPLDGKYYNTDWRKIPDYQGGFLLDGGVHFIALIRAVVGDIKQVSAQVTQLQNHLPPADTIAASFTFENGSVGTCNISFGGTATSEVQPPNLYVIGEKGSIRVGREMLEITEIKTSGTTIEKPAIHPDFEIEPIGFELVGFLDQIKNGKKDRNTPQQALDDLAVVESCLLSASTGKAITLEHFSK